MANFVSLPSGGSEIYVNMDLVRMLVQVSDGTKTQIMFDETHLAYTDLLPKDIAALCNAKSQSLE
jgi:hypothetical protein